MKKKLFLTLMMVFAVILAVFVITSCEAEHEHELSAWQTEKAPTCTSIGFQKRGCDCGYTEYAHVDAVAHTPVIDEAVAASCEATGKTEGSHCGVCNAVIVKQTETEKVAHEFLEWQTEKAPTCTSIGLDKRECGCGFVEYNVTSALSHNPVTDEAVAPTYAEPGKTEGSHCDRCGTILAAQEYIAPIEPDISEVYAKAIEYTGTLWTYDQLGELMGPSAAFVISSDGIIVANDVKTDSCYGACFVLNEEIYDVTEVLAYSEESCLIVLKIDATDLPCATLCKSEPKTGEPVYVLGANDGFYNSISGGIISNANVTMSNAVFIQHDADLDDGYSGGPLLNRFGEVIGVNVGNRTGTDVNFAASILGLDDLDYSNPMTFKEYGEATFSPVEQLVWWVDAHFTEEKPGMKAYVLYGGGFTYAIGYNEEGGYNFVEASWTLDENFTLYACVFFSTSSGTYEYLVSLNNGVWRNEVRGFIDAASYDGTTVLTYESYCGSYWTESDVMALYTAAVYDVLDWFSYLLEASFLSINIEDFGFERDLFKNDDEALDKLENYVAQKGVFVDYAGAYVYYIDASNENAHVDIEITYMPGSADAPDITYATIYYYTQSGELYIVSLYLDPTDEGNRFELFFATSNGTTYILQTKAVGYLDAGAITNISQLACNGFEPPQGWDNLPEDWDESMSMSQYEDALLADFTYYLSYMMSVLDGIMREVSPELSIKDLGFITYFN